MKYLAQSNNWEGVFGTVKPPDILDKIIKPGDTTGEGAINTILNRSVEFIFVIAAVAFVIMFLWSAVQMILSGGEKESVGKARERLTWAIIGIAILSLSFVIFKVLGAVTGFKFGP